MPQRILIIQGHPDKSRDHFCHALAEAYIRGAEEADHDIEVITVAKLDFPLLRSKEDFDTGTLTEDIKAAQESILAADHMVIIYPLLLGTMPALLTGFFEQVLRPKFGFLLTPNGRWEKRLKGRSARVVITMGMPALAYRWFFGVHSLRSLERKILGFCGIAPIRSSLVGTVESENPKSRKRWLERMHSLGKRAA